MFQTFQVALGPVNNEIPYTRIRESLIDISWGLAMAPCSIGNLLRLPPHAPQETLPGFKTVGGFRVKIGIEASFSLCRGRSEIEFH